MPIDNLQPEQQMNSDMQSGFPTSSPDSSNTPVVGSPSSPEIGYASSERAKVWGKEFLSKPDKFPCRVTMIVNPYKPEEECVLVLPDAYKENATFSDYLGTHKIVKLQTASCVQ
ncbi:MAG: hypothetical protein R2796_07045 [Chitinophagaceae bacterium]